MKLLALKVKLFGMLTVPLACNVPPANVNVSVAALPNALLLPTLTVPLVKVVGPPTPPAAGVDVAAALEGHAHRGVDS